VIIVAPGPFCGQQAAGGWVAALTGEGKALPEGAFLDEPEAAGQGAAALVAGIGVQADPVQPERAECESRTAATARETRLRPS
jgi:hypothetical protein